MRRKAATHEVVKAIEKSKSQSTRFKIKLWTDKLPHYKNISMRMGANSTANIVYSDLIKDGICQACDCQQQETLEHIMCECKAYDEVRKTMMEEVAEVRKQANAFEYWREHEWLTGERTGWEKIWGYQGFTPVTSDETRKIIKLKKQTAEVIINKAHEIWELRNQTILAWEETVGIKKIISSSFQFRGSALIRMPGLVI